MACSRHRSLLLISVAAAILLAAPATAQVEKIELDIAGYLCGF